MTGLLKSKILSSYLNILGVIVFVIPFFQILGLSLILTGTAINWRSDRTRKEKLLWTIPIVLCLILTLTIVLTADFFND